MISRKAAAALIRERETDQLVAVRQGFEGAFSGQALLIFPESNSLELVRAVTGDELSPEDLQEMEQEALSETGNIVLNGCLATMANMLQKPLTMSLPQVLRGDGRLLFDPARRGRRIRRGAVPLHQLRGERPRHPGLHRDADGPAIAGRAEGADRGVHRAGHVGRVGGAGGLGRGNEAGTVGTFVKDRSGIRSDGRDGRTTGAPAESAAASDVLERSDSASPPAPQSPVIPPELVALCGPVLDSFIHSGQAIAIADRRQPDDPLVFVNAAFEKLTGYSSAEILGRNCRFLQCRETDPAAVTEMREALAAQPRLHGRHAQRAPERRALLEQAPPHPPPGRERAPSCSSWRHRRTSRSNSHARRGDRARRRARAAGRRPPADQHHGGGQGRGRRTGNGMSARRKLYADARFAELCGLDATAARGLPTDAFFKAVHPDDRMRVRIAVAGIMHGADVFAKDYRVIAPDGSVRWVSARGASERNADNVTVRFSGVLTDTTEQKRVEERLRIAQKAGGIGTFEYVNGFGTLTVSDQFCRLLGLHPTDTLPVRTVNALVYPGDPPLIGAGATPRRANSRLARSASSGRTRARSATSPGAESCTPSATPPNGASSAPSTTSPRSSKSRRSCAISPRRWSSRCASAPASATASGTTRATCSRSCTTT